VEPRAGPCYRGGVRQAEHVQRASSVRGSPRKAPRLATLALLFALAACSGRELATPWVPPEAALVRCTTSGRDLMPPILLDLPVPAIPTGLLARQLDPMALNDMGFERDQPVCAALLQPAPEQVESARADLVALLGEYARAGAEARATLGRCACEIARASDVVHLLAPCHDEPHRPECEPLAEQVDQARAIVAPLLAVLASTSVPRIHWRIAGRSDRPGWLLDRIAELLPRHPSGATVFQQGQSIPSRNNHVLVRRLLEVPGTVAVLRLDGGRAILVVRELDGAQILDLLSFPAVDPRLVPLLPFIDEARAEDVVEALAQPDSAWAPPLPLDRGNLVHLDRAGLHAVDSLVLAMAPLADHGNLPNTLPEPAAPPLVDAVTLQAALHADGKHLRAHVRLSDAGLQWAQTLSSAPLGPDLDALGLPLEPPAPVPGLAAELDFLVHRRPAERLVLDGLYRVPSLLRTLEMHHPSTVAGHLDAWDVSLPPGAVAPGGTVPPPLELRQWAERVAGEPYRLRASFDAPRHHLDLTLAPD
jgi:hypothetical protein